MPPVGEDGKRGRIPGLDLLKFIAMMMVVGYHACAIYVYEVDEIHPGMNITRLILNNAVVSIPVFFMVTGYLLLGREGWQVKYALRRMWNIVKVSFVAMAVLEVVALLVLGHCRTPQEFVVGFVRGMMLHRGSMSVLWFMGGLLIVTMLYPLINQIFNRSRGWTLVLLGTCMLFQIFVAWAMWHKMDGVWWYEHKINQPFRLYNWVAFFLLGGMMKRYRGLWRLGHWHIVMLLTIVNLLVFQDWYTDVTGDYTGIEHTYSHPFVWIYAVSVFAWVCSLRLKGGWIKQLAVVFVPVYFMHFTMIDIVRPHIHFLPWQIGGLVFYGAVATFCVLAAWLVMQIPFVRRFLTL